jgi:hypothetical protein
VVGLSLLKLACSSVSHRAHTTELDHESFAGERHWHETCQGGDVADPAETEPQTASVCLVASLFTPCRMFRVEGTTASHLRATVAVCAVDERERHTASRVSTAQHPRAQISEGERRSEANRLAARPVLFEIAARR